MSCKLCTYKLSCITRKIKISLLFILDGRESRLVYTKDSHQNQKKFAHKYLQERIYWLFWDEETIILKNYMLMENTVTSAVQTDLENYPHQANKVQTTWTSILLQHDNPQFHTVPIFKCLPNPPYLPDLALPICFHAIRFHKLQNHQMNIKHFKRGWSTFTDRTWLFFNFIIIIIFHILIALII